jgi:hypothetical protein
MRVIIGDGSRLNRPPPPVVWDRELWNSPSLAGSARLPTLCKAETAGKPETIGKVLRESVHARAPGRAVAGAPLGSSPAASSERIALTWDRRHAPPPHQLAHLCRRDRLQRSRASAARI